MHASVQLVRPEIIVRERESQPGRAITGSAAVWGKVEVERVLLCDIYMLG